MKYFIDGLISYFECSSNEYKAVPEGIFLPTIMFSFRPVRLSVLEEIAALTKIFDVSWYEAAAKNESDRRGTCLAPLITTLPYAGFLFSDNSKAFSS
ncbi:Uncharacterised protein [Chlamydia trachomatis]|nr:Uncharacterised protein [Chlamydia trachomatis]CRH56953.1 Uncharacterised protein [Chlamydia trachomatis]